MAPAQLLVHLREAAHLRGRAQTGRNESAHGQKAAPKHDALRFHIGA